MTLIISEEELRSMLDEGLTLYKISRKFNTTIPEVFKLGRSYGIHFAYDHTHIPYPNKQDLKSMYHDEGMTQYQISREFNVDHTTVHGWLRYYNISTVGHQGVKVQIPPKEVLQRMYTDEGMHQWQIGKEFDVTDVTVGGWLHYYNIPTRGSKGTLYVPIPPKEVLQRMYSEDGMTQEQIGKEFDVIGATVGVWLRYYNIPTRGNGTLAVPMPPKEDLLNYIAEGLNQHQIAKYYKVSDWKIFDWCEKIGITGMVNNFRITTPEHINWRDAVLERDNYICQECGSQYKLQAHHIKRYCDYPELELDIDNGITLCKRCHEQTFHCEYQYIVKYEDIVLRDRGIGDFIVQPNPIIDYPQEVPICQSL